MQHGNQKVTNGTAADDNKTAHFIKFARTRSSTLGDFMLSGMFWFPSFNKNISRFNKVLMRLPWGNAPSLTSHSTLPGRPRDFDRGE